MLKPSFFFLLFDLPSDPNADVSLTSMGAWPASERIGDLGSILDALKHEGMPPSHCPAEKVDFLIQDIIAEAEAKRLESSRDIKGEGRSARVLDMAGGFYVLELSIIWQECHFDVCGYRAAPYGPGFRIEPCEMGERKEEE